MIITYASHHTWYKFAKGESIDHYGKSDRKKLLKSLGLAKSANVRVEFKKADVDFLDWFLPMYERIIGAKKNANLFNIKALFDKQPDSPSLGYYTLTLFEGDSPIGGCIFNDYGWYYSMAYRVYEQDWLHANLPATPAFFSELQLDIYTRQNNRKMLSHGRDRNPYGLNSAIGLSIFKLATGCKARTALTHEIKQIETDTIKEDCLILHHPNQGRRIKEATLVCSTQTQDRYIQLFKYPERLIIHTINRTEL